MKKWFLYIFPLMLLSMFVTACKHRIEPDDKGGKTTALSLIVEIKEGLRLENEVVSYPVVNMTVNSEDDAANYTLAYSIDNRAEKKINSLWNGKKVSLSGDFKDNDGFGRHTIHAKLVNDENVEDCAVIDTCVWIAYRLTEYSAPIFVTKERTVELEDNVVLYNGEEGNLEFHYAPSGSILPVELVVDESSPIKLDESKRSCKNGLLSVPVKISGKTETLLRVKLENGEQIESKDYYIICKDDTEGVTLGLEMSAAPLSVWSEGLDVSLNIKDKQTRTYDVVFEVDGQMVDAIMGHSAAGALERTVPSGSLNEGEHTLAVTVMDATKHSVSVTKETKFYHCKPTISLNDKPYGKGEQIEVNTSSVYTVRCSGIPASYYNLVSLVSSDKNMLVEKQGTSGGVWTFTPLAYGRGTIMLNITTGKGVSLPFPVVRYQDVLVHFDKTEDFIYKVSISASGASTVDFTVSGKAEYAAQCDYEKAVDDGTDDHGNESMTRTDWPGTKDFSITLKHNSVGPLVDLSERYAFFATQKYYSEVWDTIKQNQKKTVDFPYYLVVTSLNVNVSVPLTLENRDCFRFSTDTSWGYLHFN